jgi:hypothetical protein
MLGAIDSVSETFRVDQKQLERSNSARLQTYTIIDIQSFISSPKKKGNSGSPQQWICQDVRDAVSLLLLNQRRTIRLIASALEIPKSTVLRMRRDPNDVVIMPNQFLCNPS